MESIDFHEGLPTGSPVDSDQVVSSILFSDAAADVVDSDLFDQSMAYHPRALSPASKSAYWTNCSLGPFIVQRSIMQPRRKWRHLFTPGMPP